MVTGLDAIVINTSGCGTTVKDYGHMFRNDPWRRMRRGYRQSPWMSASCWCNWTCPKGNKSLTVAYHAACSLQHGQGIKTYPKDLLKTAGFTCVRAC